MLVENLEDNIEQASVVVDDAIEDLGSDLMERIRPFLVEGYHIDPPIFPAHHEYMPVKKNFTGNIKGKNIPKRRNFNIRNQTRRR